jgi:hypothetical protein
MPYVSEPFGSGTGTFKSLVKRNHRLFQIALNRHVNYSMLKLQLQQKAANFQQQEE